MSYILDLVNGRLEGDTSRYGPSVGVNSGNYSRRVKGLPDPTRPKPALCESGCGRLATDLDHCHLTGLFRGWLCNQCNSALGFTKDQPAILRSLAAYLERGGA